MSVLDSLLEDLHSAQREVENSREEILALNVRIVQAENAIWGIRSYARWLAEDQNLILSEEFLPESNLSISASTLWADQSLADAAYLILQETGRGMKLSELWYEMSQRGMTSKSNLPENILRQALARDRRIYQPQHRVGYYLLVERQNENSGVE